MRFTAYTKDIFLHLALFFCLSFQNFGTPAQSNNYFLNRLTSLPGFIFTIYCFWFDFLKHLEIFCFSVSFYKLFEISTWSLNSCHGKQTGDFLFTVDFLKC